MQWRSHDFSIGGVGGSLSPEPPTVRGSGVPSNGTFFTKNGLASSWLRH